MANYATLKAAISAVITTNGNNEITGAILQQTLLTIINSLGAGYQFAGVAEPNTNPGTPDQNMFYLAGKSGIYSNFNSVSVSYGEICVLKYNGSWEKLSVGKFGTREEIGEMQDAEEVALSGFSWKSGQGVQAANGNLTNSTVSSYCDYIDISQYAGQELSYTRPKITGASSTIGLAFYTAAKTYISGETYLTGQESAGYYLRTGLLIPANAAYVRFSFRTVDTANFSASVSSGEFSYSTGLGKRVQDLEFSTKNIESVLAEKIDVSFGKNLFNKDDVTAGKYFNRATGTTGNNANYYITNQYIPVKPGDTMYISNGSDSAVCGSAGFLIFYDSNKTVVSGVAMGVKSYTVPDGAAYMRFSIYGTWFVKIQVEVGTERTSFEEYSPIGGYPVNIPDSSISFSKLDSSLQNKINSVGGPSTFGHLSVSGTLNAGENVRTDYAYLDKDSLLSVLIRGIITTVQVGVGKTASGFTYFAHWLEIDQTNVKLYWYNNSTNVLIATYAHGLTLTENTTIIVDSTIANNTKSTTLKIFNDLGGQFTQSLPEWGVGRGFVVNIDSGALDVSVALMPRQISKKIWLFGDSYISFTSNQRWPYYFAQLGMLNYFSNNQPGQQPDTAYNTLLVMLSLGHVPTYLVWTLGMNGATTETQSGGEYVINSAQKAVIDNVVATCKENGITPVFATIPTVPTRQKTGFNKYIRSLGYRYIDFANAVGADSSGNWNEGLLSNDGVHPTAAGARVLASRVFIDFPELSIME